MSLTMFQMGKGKWGKRIIATFGLLTALAMVAGYVAPLFFN
jgi:hypothetical protein